MARAKKLTLDEVRKLDDKEYGTSKKIKIQGFVVTVQTKFRPSEISELVADVINLLGEMIEKDINLRNNLTPVLTTLIIKKFTDIEGIPSDLVGVLEATRYMVDNDILKPVFACFDEQEIAKMNLHLARVINGIDGISTSVELKQALEKVEEVKDTEAK